MKTVLLSLLLAPITLLGQVVSGIDVPIQRVVEGVTVPQELTLPLIETTPTPVRFKLTDPTTGKDCGTFLYAAGTALGEWQLQTADLEGFSLGKPFQPAEAKLPFKSGTLIPAVPGRPARLFVVESPSFLFQLPPQTRVLLLPANDPKVRAELETLRQALARTARIRNDSLATLHRTDLQPVTVRTPYGNFARPLTVKPSEKQQQSAHERADYFAYARLDELFRKYPRSVSTARGSSLRITPDLGAWVMLAHTPTKPRNYWLSVITLSPLRHTQITLDASNARRWDQLFF